METFFSNYWKYLAALSISPPSHFKGTNQNQDIRIQLCGQYSHSPHRLIASFVNKNKQKQNNLQ